MPSIFFKPTENCGTPCQQLSPLTTDGCIACSWSGAFESLNYIYGGDLQPPMMNNSLNSCSLPDDNVPGLFTFDQTEFFPRGYFSD